MTPACCALALLAAAAGRAPSAAPAGERDCLLEYVRARSRPEDALRVLAECARRFPDSAVVQGTFARRMLREGRERNDREMLDLSAAAFDRIARLDPSMLSEADWMNALELHRAAGRTEEELGMLEAALPYLRERAPEAWLRAWQLGRELDRPRLALAAWSEIRFRLLDSFDDQLAAARLLRADGQPDDAQDHYERALELRPSAGDVRLELCGMLIEAATSRRELRSMLDTCAPLSRELDVDSLERLLEAALELVRPGEALDVARAISERDDEHGLAHLVLAEEALAERDWLAAIRGARIALRGGVRDERRARALLGEALAERARERYRAAGTASPTVLDPIVLQLREAQRLLRDVGPSEAHAESVLADVDAVLATLRELRGELRLQRLTAQRRACDELHRRAVRRRELDQPLRRWATSELAVLAAPDTGEPIARAAEGASLVLTKTEWLEGRCWLRVKAPDGAVGWVPDTCCTP